MSADLDLSQYLRKPQEEQSEPAEEEFDLSQYRRKGAVEKVARKTGRLGGQLGIGAAEAATMPYNLAAIGAQTIARNPLLDVTERQKKNDPKLAKELDLQQSPIGRGLSEGLEKKLGEQREYAKDKGIFPEWVKEQNWDVGGLLEKGFEYAGIDMKPEDAAEHAVRWAAFIRDPKKLQQLTTKGIDLAKGTEKWADFTKAILPSGKEALRGVGAGTALQLAAENELGPIGTLVAAVIGDVSGAGLPGVAKGVGNFLRHPVQSSKELAARAVVAGTRLSGAEKQSLQKDLIQQFRDAGIQADLGSITGSNLVKAIQARLAQSGLVGSALDDFRKGLTTQIVGEYKNLANELGEARFESIHEAGKALKEGLEKGREADAKIYRSFYDDARKIAESPDAVVYPDRLISAIQNLEKRLAPGGVKAGEQKAVLKVLEDLKGDLMDAEGRLKTARVNSLMNNKFAINDIVDYEVQGGAKQLLKGINKEIDRTIQQYGRQSPEFLQKWMAANSRFAKHAQTFRNKHINDILRGQDPTTIMNKMNTVEGIKRIKRALGTTPEGERLFNDIKRAKFDEVVFKNMVDGATEQLKIGKFSNILEKGKNREVVRELLGNDSFHRLERLQNASGKLAESAQKYFNASKSGTTAIDAALITKALFDIGSLIGGNPWPIMRTAGFAVGARAAASLITDPVFLKAVEDGMLAGAKGDVKSLKSHFNYLYGGLVGQEAEKAAMPKGTQLSPQEMQEASQRRGMQRGAGKAEGMRPEAPGEVEQQLAPEFKEQVFEVNPKYRTVDPKYTKPLKERTHLERQRDYNPEDHQVAAPTVKLSPEELRTYRNEWEKYFPDKNFNDFYGVEMGERTRLGKLGDWIQGEDARRILKDVLDVPVHKIDTFASPGGWYNTKSKQISIHRNLSPSGILRVLHHEGYHALQDLKGKLFNYPPVPYLPYINEYFEYYSKAYEIKARLFERWAQRDVQKYRATLAKSKATAVNRHKLGKSQ